MQNKEYLVNVGGKSYRDALAHCKTRGGKLVEPKSDQANNDIVDLAKAIETEGNGVWIGINDKSEEGKFSYASDGKSLTYTNWNPGQPDDGENNEDCGYLRDKKYKNNKKFKWNDAPCSSKKSFICDICFEKGYNYDGDELKIYSYVEDAKSCQKKCQDEPEDNFLDCKFWVYFESTFVDKQKFQNTLPDPKSCWLKMAKPGSAGSDTTKSDFTSGITAGPKECGQTSEGSNPQDPSSADSTTTDGDTDTDSSWESEKKINI